MALLTRRKTRPVRTSAAALRAGWRGARWAAAGLALALAGANDARASSVPTAGAATVATEAATPEASEAAIKAALLFNLTQFVEWPADAFTGQDAPLIIGLLGGDPFGEELDELVRREPPGARPIVVQRFRDPRAAAQSHVLFVDGSQRDRLQQVFAAVGDRPVLTVADFDGFLRRGGLVRFYRNSENKIRVRLNLPGTRDARLTISAKLLRVVEIVPPEEE